MRNTTATLSAKQKTTNIKNDLHLTFKRFVCVGHMSCTARNSNCRKNQVPLNEQDGVPINNFHVGLHAPSGANFVYRHCKVSAFWCC